jgi:hypothetical protein
MSADVAADLRALLRPLTPAESRELIAYQADAAVEAAASAWQAGDVDGHAAHIRAADVWGTALEALS